MAIMSHDEWKRRTSLALKPRSKPLKFLDACLKEYDKNRGSRPHFDAIVVAYQAWAATKASAEGSERNAKGAVSDLLAQLVEFRDRHMPFAHRGGAPLRPNALLLDIKEGAKLLGEGNLRPQIKVNIPVGIKDIGRGTVIWEEFDDTQLPKARQGWADAFECAEKAVAAIATVDGNAAEEQRFQRWFGAPTPQAVATVKQGLQQMLDAFSSSPVTIVLREDVTVHIVNGNDPFDEMEQGFKGDGVYGYVWNHHAGSGYRIIMGKWFLADPDPLEGAAQTIYHELTHKVLKTQDHVYGKIKCRGLSATNQAHALTNADSWAFYALSFMKNI
ncbi:M35 family metallo-endopeptidase [Paraburkholderia sp. RL18-101-BIB-B]|jgi:hypothetical protein|uniref:M35 family metallo-endopeptidase n=1 Tax=unclassified Paraburkholderia TaxID=2615204 RepID=UPI0038B9C07F